MSNLRFYLSLFLSLRIKKQIPQRLLQGFSSILSVDFRSDSQTLFLAESLVLVSLEVFFFFPLPELLLCKWDSVMQSLCIKIMKKYLSGEPLKRLQ